MKDDLKAEVWRNELDAELFSELGWRETEYKTWELYVSRESFERDGRRAKIRIMANIVGSGWNKYGTLFEAMLPVVPTAKLLAKWIEEVPALNAPYIGFIAEDSVYPMAYPPLSEILEKTET